MPRFTDNSPGGFFDNVDSSASNSNSANRGTPSDTPAAGGGTVNPAANNSAAQSATDARQYAGDARGWAVGTNTGDLSGWSATNNSRYWSTQAMAAYTNTQTLVNGIDTDALRSILAQAITARDQAVAADNDARGQADAAQNSAGEALNQANRATTAATTATTQANNAAASAQTASTGATTATAQATAATNSATASANSATQAAASATQAGTSANASAASATQSAGSATTATTQATAAAQSATEASTSATNASNSATLAMSWALDTESGSNAYNQNSARYWARQAAASAAANTVYDSDITVTVGSNMTGGGTFSLNQDSDETINIGLNGNVIVNATQSGDTVTLTKENGTTVQFTIGSGGGGPDIPSNLFTLSLSQTSIEFDPSGSAAEITVTLTPVTGFTFSSANSTVHGTNGATITTSNNTSSFTFQAPINVAGTISVVTSAVMTRTSDSSTHSANETARLRIEYGWYYSRHPAAPNSVTDLSNRGVWRGQSSTALLAPSGTNTLYVAIPARTGGYYIADGDTTLVPPRLGTTFDTHWLLYSTNEAVAGTTYQIVEA